MSHECDQIWTHHLDGCFAFEVLAAPPLEFLCGAGFVLSGGICFLMTNTKRNAILQHATINVCAEPPPASDCRMTSATQGSRGYNSLKLSHK
eukprot:6041276-Amphidinium_carterae.1